MFILFDNSVSTLQSVLGRKCKVGSKDVVLLSSKGHLLDAKETLGAYDAGTVSIDKMCNIIVELKLSL